MYGAAFTTEIEKLILNCIYIFVVPFSENPLGISDCFFRRICPILFTPRSGHRRIARHQARLNGRCVGIIPAREIGHPSLAFETVMTGRKQLLPPLPSESQIILIRRRGHTGFLFGPEESVCDKLREVVCMGVQPVWKRERG